MRTFKDFEVALSNAKIMLGTFGEEVNTGHWQGVSTEGKPDLVTTELMNWQASVPVHRSYEQLEVLREEIKPSLPWADDHFEERVSRVPSNPGEEYKNWPWWHGQELAFANKTADLYDKTDGQYKFSHTYQERFWPKHEPGMKHGRETFRRGIHYEYGDLDDVVSLLLTEPYTRQAYFPIFFPEDTGAVHGGRIPCTLGYHFLLRNNKLHMWYEIRSCDYVRHLRDDVYLACRLLLWVLDELVERELRLPAGHETPTGYSDQVWVDVDPGYLHFLAHSLHYHKGDAHHVN